jgi:protein tyrosine phosphatase (PTP) superfamily phosphohydrolase (DUF442 family)
MNAENSHQVFDWLWTSGQLSARDIGELPSLGIKSVVNLALPTAANALPGEAELVTGAGINYFQIPVPWEKPELHHLDLFFSLVGAMHGEPTWVHCAKNMRVSAFIYLYRRLCLAESEDAASFPLRAVWQPNEIWSEFISGALQADSSFKQHR